MSESLTFQFGERRVVFSVGRIERAEADAIVNAANSSLLGGGGVDGAIHRAGGPEILEDCRRIVSQIGHLPAGQAVATTAGKLKARYVIHTVGPIWSGGYEGEPETLASCYRESLSRAEELHLRSVAFPAISTGAYGYPVEDAARVAIATIVDAIQSSSIHRVDLVLFNKSDFDIHVQTMQKFVAAHPHLDATLTNS